MAVSDDDKAAGSWCVVAGSCILSDLEAKIELCFQGKRDLNCVADDTHWILVKDLSGLHKEVVRTNIDFVVWWTVPQNIWLMEPSVFTFRSWKFEEKTSSWQSDVIFQYSNITYFSWPFTGAGSITTCQWRCCTDFPCTVSASSFAWGCLMNNLATLLV